MHYLLGLLLFSTVFFIPPAAHADDCNAEYAELIPSKLAFSGVSYSSGELTCLPVDITAFDIETKLVDIGLGKLFRVEGVVNLGKIPPRYKAFNGKYTLYLKAYVISRNGDIVWEQGGFPQGDVQVKIAGGERKFSLTNQLKGSLWRARVVVIAAADPILSDEGGVGPVILGAAVVRARK